MADILDAILEGERGRLHNTAGGADEVTRLEKEFTTAREATQSKGQGRLDHRFRIIRNEAELDALVAVLQAAGDFTFDIETTGLNPFTDKLVGLGFCICTDHGYYIPVGHNESTPQLSEEFVLSKLKPILETKPVTGHNLKFEYKFMLRRGIKLNLAFDTQVAAHLANENESTKLKSVAQRVLGVADWCLDLEEQNCAERSIREVGPYCIRDCLHTLALRKQFEPVINADFKFLFHEVEMPVVEALAQMELNGVPIDTGYLTGLHPIVTQHLDRLAADVRAVAGQDDFNLNSSEQLADLLYVQLKLPVPKQTETGKPSTDAEALEAIKGQHPVVGQILDYKGLEKLRSTYLNPVVCGITQRMHPEYFQLGTETGRMTGSGKMHPLTIPRDKSGQHSIRQAIGGVKGFLLVSADYAAQEPRITAACANDSKMKAAFAAGWSIHGHVAKLMFSLTCDPNEVKDKYEDEYKKGKAVGLGVVYGKTAWGIARDFTQLLGREVTEEEGQKFIDDYFAQFPAVKTWLDGVVATAKKQGHVVDLAGRRRRFKFIQKKLAKGDKIGWKAQKGEEREAMNFMVQGFAASVTKRAMVRCHKRLAVEHPSVQLIAARHDELVFLVPDAELDAACQVIKEGMEVDPELQARGLDVPMVVEITCGPNWSSVAQKKWQPQTGA